MTVRFFSPKKVEYDIEVPLNITAYDLFVALNEAFKLNYNIDVKEACYLCTESPITFLVGDRLLSDYGLRNGTVINILSKSHLRSSTDSNYLKDFIFENVTFDYAVDLSARRSISIGNNDQCNLIDTNVLTPQVNVELFNDNDQFFLKAKNGTAVSCNGKSLFLRMSLCLFIILTLSTFFHAAFIFIIKPCIWIEKLIFGSMVLSAER